MIDIENEVFDRIYNRLVAKFSDINITGDYIATPSEFPCASIYEADNNSYDKTQDSSGNENHAHLLYEVYVFSNKKNGRKAECKSIYKVIDEELLLIGFSRLAKQPLSRDDGSIYQIFGRYEAVVSKENTIFRR